MIEILPLRLLTNEDVSIFGSEGVCLGKLLRAGLFVAPGIVITPPYLKLKATLEHYNFGSKELFRESLVLIEKDIKKIPVPQILVKETGKHKKFLLNGVEIKSVRSLWFALLDIWLNEIKSRLWNNGFYPGITTNLPPQTVIFIKKLKARGLAYFDPVQDEVEIKIIAGKLYPAQQKRILEIVTLANKKLFIPHEYEWILEDQVKLSGLKPYTPSTAVTLETFALEAKKAPVQVKQSAVKVLFDLSDSFTIENNIDGVFIASEKIFDLNKPRESFDNLAFKVVESALTFPDKPILFKLADKSEGMGKVRGSLRLIHQKSLLSPLVEILDFARHKKSLLNVHVVIPFVRNVNELLQMKRELATSKLVRKNSLKIWMEAAVPENIINLESYLEAGIDGVVLNLDELLAYLNGFDHLEEELLFYKNEISGLIKFLEDALKLLHKANVPFIAYGSLSSYPQMLEFLVEKGIFGIVVEKYDAQSAKDLLYQLEKRVILKKFKD